jgi:hypothetical protein
MANVRLFLPRGFDADHIRDAAAALSMIPTLLDCICEWTHIRNYEF